MEREILLSIIIPVYNVQDYIGKCLNSLITVDERIEIFVVDDGSPDNSSEIVKDIMKNFHLVQYLNIILLVNG